MTTNSVVFWGEKRSGGELLLGAPESLELKKDKGAADLLTVRFPAAGIWENLRAVRGYLGETLVFSGICDEQSTACGGGGMEAEIVARSLAALLIDNEVRPQTLRNPTFSFLSRHFTEPLGLRIEEGEVGAAGELAVKKGTSVMGLLNELAARLSVKSLSVSADGVISLDPRPKIHRLSDLAEWRVSERNCDVVSEVFVKNAFSGAYSVRFVNPGANGIQRRRYVEGGYDFTVRRKLQAAVPGFALIGLWDEIILPQGFRGQVTGVRVTGGRSGYVTRITAEEITA